ncbi:MAG: membrane protease YdiL (CAAX protease family) [Polaribacter sp.]|jgi:membrane protease YdiL (CAAX protease family)
MFLKKVRDANHDWWRWLATILLVFGGYVLGQIPLFWLMNKAVSDANDGTTDLAEVNELAQSMDFASYGMDQNLVLVTVLLMFVFGTLALWLGIAKIHGRPFRTLITPLKQLNWSKIFFSFGLWMLFSLVLEGGSYFIDSDNYTFNFELSSFIPLLIISLTLLPIQTSFEELFMRGYLMQGISLWAPMRWIPLLITSIIFGLMHIMNPEVQAFGMWLMMSYYMGVGLFLGILTLMDDSLELALGVHAATNIFGALFVTFESSALQTPAVFQLKEVEVQYMIPVFFVAALLFTVVCARKYGWSEWSRIYGQVDVGSEGEEEPWVDKE